MEWGDEDKTLRPFCHPSTARYHPQSRTHASKSIQPCVSIRVVPLPCRPVPLKSRSVCPSRGAYTSEFSVLSLALYWLVMVMTIETFLLLSPGSDNARHAMGARARVREEPPWDHHHDE